MARSTILMTLNTTCNKLNANGGYAICEYGILYSQNSVYSTSATLTLTAVGQSYVGKSSRCGFLKPGTYYSSFVDDLDGSKITYYRAFAKNTNHDVAYGLIRNIAAVSTIQEQLPDKLLPNTEVGVSGGVYYTYDLETGTYVYLGLTE